MVSLIPLTLSHVFGVKKHFDSEVPLRRLFLGLDLSETLENTGFSAVTKFTSHLSVFGVSDPKNIDFEDAKIRALTVNDRRI